jgi:hypothetical protein
VQYEAPSLGDHVAAETRRDRVEGLDREVGTFVDPAVDHSAKCIVELELALELIIIVAEDLRGCQDVFFGLCSPSLVPDTG